jgi:4-hydroxybenzoate polyprenyltransferase
MNKAQAWINLLRLSNTPTLISNVMVGLGLGMVAHQLQWSDSSFSPTFTPLVTLVLITIALLSAYFGGLVLNDVVDVEHDKKHRPLRPIPMGIIPKKQATLIGSALLVLPVLIAMCTQVRAAYFMIALSSCILIYTFLHRYLLPSLIFMGVCRGLVYVVAFSAFDVAFQAEPLLIFAVGITWYTAVLTLIAKNEHTHNKTKRWFVLLLLPTAFIPAMIYYTEFQLIFILLALVIFTTWIAVTFVIFQLTSKSVHGIHAMLAGFCLLDFVYLSIIGELNIAIISGICFLFTLAAQRKILGT